MNHHDQLIHNFTALGNDFLKASLQMDDSKGELQSSDSLLASAIEKSYAHNPWFIPLFVRFAYHAWAEALQEEKVTRWIRDNLPGKIEKHNPAIVGIIMAGNIPMVGLHDLFCVLASGNHALIKLSLSDDQLIPSVLETLCHFDPEFRECYSIAEGPLKNFDAIIATGSNNSSRYFDYYFGKYPHIIRKNRNSVAVITGSETEDELKRLADDIFLYFGLGCRNVSKLYFPEGLKIETILPFFESYAYLSDLHKYRNNYDYQKSILLINRVPHLDNGFLLIKPDASMMSPISVIHTESYSSAESLNQHLYIRREQIQCIISASDEIDNAIPPGRSQFPELWDYADSIDTMGFLMNL
jgi:hypothetical protein